jgi:hypothetical protein
MVRRPYIMGALACMLPLVDNLSTGLYQPVPFLLGGGDVSGGRGTGEAVIYIKDLCYELIRLFKLLEFCLFVLLEENLGVLLI